VSHLPHHCAVEEQLKATSPKASEAPILAIPESLAAHVTASAPLDTQQQLLPDLVNDLVASEAIMQDGLASAVDSLTGSASKAQQAAALSYGMGADIGDVSAPSSIPDGGFMKDDDLSDAAAQDLAAAAEEAAHAASLSAADESPDASSTAESAPQDFVSGDPADSGAVSPPSSTPDGAGFLPSDDGLSDAAAEDLAAAAEEAAHSAADESSDAEGSGSHVSAPQSFFGDHSAESGAVSPQMAAVPDGNRLPENDISDAVVEDLAAAADAAAQTSASSSELQTDAGSHAMDSDTEQGTEGRVDLVSAQSSSSSSVSPPLELRTSIVSDLSEIQLLRSQVCILPVSVSVCLSVCLSVCPPGTVQLLSHEKLYVKHVICPSHVRVCHVYQQQTGDCDSGLTTVSHQLM